MAITVVDHSDDFAANAGGGGIVAGNGILPAAGDILVVGIAAYNGDGLDLGSATVVSSGWDNSGVVGPWTQIATTGNQVGTNGHCLAEIWWAPVNQTASVFGEATVTLVNNAWVIVTFQILLSGTATTAVVGAKGNGFASGSGGGASDLGITTDAVPASDSMVVGICGSDYQFSGSAITAPAGFTTLDHYERPAAQTHFGQGLSCEEIGAGQTNHFGFAAGAGNDLYGVFAEFKVPPPPPPPKPIHVAQGAAITRASVW